MNMLRNTILGAVLVTAAAALGYGGVQLIGSAAPDPTAVDRPASVDSPTETLPDFTSTPELRKNDDVPFSVQAEMDLLMPEFGADAVNHIDDIGYTSTVYCRADADAGTNADGIVTVALGHEVDATQFVGRPLLRMMQVADAPRPVPGDVTKPPVQYWSGPVHFDADGNLVRGWAICLELEY